MSQSGGFPSREPAPAPASDIPMWIVVTAVVVMLALVGVAAYVFVLRKPAAAGPTYPKVWDSRIAPYARIAEKERGLFFLHPVSVRFLSPTAFAKTVTGDEKDLTKSDKEELAQATGMLRALGLLHGDVNLFKAVNQTQGGETLAYYSFDDKTITVRGNTVTPAVGATLVHELTHVLQDQRFDIGARLTKLRKDKNASSSAESIFDSLVEGDAQRVEALYTASLPLGKRKAIANEQRGEQVTATRQLKGVPPVVVTFMTAPYTLGQGLLQAVDQDGGNAAVDQLFRKPPEHENVLLDPFKELDGKTDATKVAAPKLASGEKKYDAGELGVVTWYLMLAARLPLHDALAAADGWGGDSYVSYGQGGVTCARIDYAGRTAADTTRMYSSLRRWVASSPRGTASVRRTGSTLEFQSCDPGTSVRVGKDDSEQAITLVAIRASLGTTYLKQGLSHSRASCISRGLTTAFSPAQLTDPKFGAHDPSVVLRAQAIGASCH